MLNALSLAKLGHDVGRIATLNCALSQAYGWCGLIKQAIAANDAAVSGLPYVKKSDCEFLGYSVDHWAKALRSQYLVRLGRFNDAETCLETLLNIEGELGDPTLQFVPHLAYVELAWCRNDPDLAGRHARRVVEIAENTRIPYLRLYGFACTGTAKSLEQDYVGALRDFRTALEFMREAQASLGFEANIIAAIADCHLRMNELEPAGLMATAAIETAQRRSTRLPECRASIIKAASLLALDDPDRHDEAISLFRHAEQLIDITGATIYTPLLLDASKRSPVAVV